MRSFLSQSDMMAYLTMMAQRMVELHRVLKPTGSIYLHCDPTASHYLKLLMDSVFGPARFRNEIIWKRTSAHSASIRWNDVHDCILYYTKSDSYVWNPILLPHSPEYTARYKRVGLDGRSWTDDNLTAPGVRRGDSGAAWRGLDPTAKGLHWKVSAKAVESILGVEGSKELTTTQKLDVLDDHGMLYWATSKSETSFPRFKRYLAEGAPIQDVITDIPPLNSQARERLGYPTQKPEALLERIINSSSNEGDLVLDPFCGCGTAIAVAERLKRRWIGVDVTHLAISLMKNRLQDSYGDSLAGYEVIGDPKDEESARALARESEHDGRYQFQYWAAGLVDARPGNGGKKGADKGVDGYITFFDDNSGKAKTIVVQVKSGKVQRNDIATLKGDMERENAVMGLFLTLEDPTEPMHQEAIGTGFYIPDAYPNYKFPKIQIVTIRDLLAGNAPQIPRLGLSKAATFKRAPHRNKAEGTTQPML